jgi:SAM-dependent methyltransferase
VSVHRAASEGFSRDPAEYDRGRPDYPQAAVDWLAERLDLGAGRTVVDLAAGTGKLTKLLVPTGARVIAIEPVAEMRALIGPGAEVLAGTAESIPLDDASADAVTVAQAFHWFDPEPAVAEIRRVLRPGGALAIVWNSRRDDAPLNVAIREVIEPYRADAPTHRNRPWQRALGPPDEEAEFDNPQHVQAGALGARIASISFVSRLPEDKRAAVVAAVDELAGGEAVTIPQRTDIQLFRLRPC